MRPRRPYHPTGVSARRRRGGVAILLLTSAAAVIGTASLCLDGGRLYLSKQRAQNAADAAAFAGGMELPNETRAREAAARVAAANGFRNPTVTFAPRGTIDPGEIRVQCEQAVPLLFAALASSKQTAVRAQSLVGSTPPANVAYDIVPWGVQMGAFTYGESFTLKLGSSKDGLFAPGNFQALALGGTGADNYRNNVANGWTRRIEVGQMVTTETGNMVGPTDNGIAARIERASTGVWAGNTWNNYAPGNPQVAIVPLVDWNTALNGRTEAMILGFGAFWIDSGQNGGGGNVTGRFIQFVDPRKADFELTVLPGIDGGVYGCRLDA